MKQSCTIYSSLAFLFIQSLLFSQRSNTFLRHYGVEDGLPSSEVYDVIQDSKGYMWFATDRGVCRFDGNEFVSFTRENGLPDNTVFKLFEDYKKRLWFVTFSLKLAWYKDGKIHVYPHNQIIRETPGNSTIYTNFYVDRLDNIYLSIYGKGLLKIDQKGNLTQDCNGKQLTVRQ
jgi:ligand-binding sensor domain-containing protein